MSDQNTNILKSHCMSMHNDISQICQPFFKSTDVEFFSFARFFQDGTAVILTSDNRWISNHFAKQYNMQAPIPSHLLQQKFVYCIPFDCEYSTVIKDAIDILNINNPIDIVKVYPSYYDLFCLSTGHLEYSSENIYLNQLESIRQFCDDFEVFAKPLIKTAEANKIILPKSMQPHLLNQLDLMRAKSQASRQFTTKTGYTEQLTPTEMLSLEMYVNGYTYKEISNIRSSSIRTVEHHIQRVKNKLQTRSRSELRKIFMQQLNRH